MQNEITYQLMAGHELLFFKKYLIMIVLLPDPIKPRMTGYEAELLREDNQLVNILNNVFPSTVEFVICFKDCAELLMLCKVLLSTLQQGYQSKSGEKKKKKLIVFKVNEGHPSSTVCQSICFFFFAGLVIFFKQIIFPLLTSQFLYQPLTWLRLRPSLLEPYQFSSFVSSNRSSTLHLP